MLASGRRHACPAGRARGGIVVLEDIDEHSVPDRPAAHAAAARGLVRRRAGSRRRRVHRLRPSRRGRRGAPGPAGAARRPDGVRLRHRPHRHDGQRPSRRSGHARHRRRSLLSDAGESLETAAMATAAAQGSQSRELVAQVARGPARLPSGPAEHWSRRPRHRDDSCSSTAARPERKSVVADVAVLGPDGGHVRRVRGAVAGEYREVGVAEHGAVRRRRQPDRVSPSDGPDERPRRREALVVRAGQGPLGQPRRPLLVVVSAYVVHGVVVPGGQRTSCGPAASRSERVDGVEDCPEVVQAVIVPGRFGVAADQVVADSRTQRGPALPSERAAGRPGGLGRVPSALSRSCGQ